MTFSLRLLLLLALLAGGGVHARAEAALHCPLRLADLVPCEGGPGGASATAWAWPTPPPRGPTTASPCSTTA